MNRFIDLIGRRFNKLLVIGYKGQDKWHISKWTCLCDCGNKVVITSNHLKSNHTKSCGCIKKEGNAKTHGLEGTKIYNIWQCMKQRCNNKNNRSYKDYGGRGIKICKKWMKFENFYKDVGDLPKGKSLDRINNNGNYEPNNWRWATRKEQSRNKRNNINITYNGKTQCLNDWSKELNINKSVVIQTLLKLNKNPETVLNIVIKMKNKGN